MSSQISRMNSTAVYTAPKLEPKTSWSPWLFLWQDPLDGLDPEGLSCLPSAREVPLQPPVTDPVQVPICEACREPGNGLSSPLPQTGCVLKR